MCALDPALGAAVVMANLMVGCFGMVFVCMQIMSGDMAFDDSILGEEQVIVDTTAEQVSIHFPDMSIFIYHRVGGGVEISQVFPEPMAVEEEDLEGQSVDLLGPVEYESLEDNPGQFMRDLEELERSLECDESQLTDILN